jgi:hypothetical protein
MKAPLVDNRVDNPKYLAWKKFPVGAKADYVEDLLHEYQPGTDAYTKSRIARLTFTLVSIDDERAVVKAESTVSRRTGGDSYSSDDQIFKAKVPAPGAHSDNPTQVLTRGEETLTINGKEIHTRWECVAQAKDPLTFTKTWTSDEVPGGLVRLQQQTHSGLIAGQDYRSISQTFYAPLAGVEPVLGNDAPPADTANHAPAPANPASPTGGKGAAIAPVPTASAPPPAAPPSRGAPAMTPDFTKRFSAVMMRAAKDQVGLAQAEAGLSRAGTALPDHIRAARDRMTSQQQAVALAFRTRDNAAAEQNLRALEDTLAVIEKFIGK